MPAHTLISQVFHSVEDTVKGKIKLQNNLEHIHNGVEVTHDRRYCWGSLNQNHAGHSETCY